MPFGRVIGHGPGNIVLGGDPAPKGAQPSPIFDQCLLFPNGWMDQGELALYGGRLRPRPRCVRWGPSPPKRRSAAPPNIRPMSIVTKRHGWIKCTYGGTPQHRWYCTQLIHFIFIAILPNFQTLTC